MKATCDNCNQTTTTDFKRADHPRGIQETYFNCTQCNKRYTCFVTDKAVRAKQKEMRSLSGVANTDKRIKLQDEINQRMAELKQDLMYRER